MYITYNIGNYNRHLNSKRHQKKNSLDNPVGKPDNDLLHKTPEFEKDSSEIKKDSLDKLVGKIENDLLHENSNSDIYICLKCNYKTAICSNYYRHLRTKKHLCKDYEITEKTYECNNCKFKSKHNILLSNFHHIRPTSSATEQNGLERNHYHLLAVVYLSTVHFYSHRCYLLCKVCPGHSLPQDT